MARITIEDCLHNVDNMYELVLVATRRTRQLYSGAKPLMTTKNRLAVTALREIASGKVRPHRDDHSTPDEASADELAGLSN